VAGIAPARPARGTARYLGAGPGCGPLPRPTLGTGPARPSARRRPPSGRAAGLDMGPSRGAATRPYGPGGKHLARCRARLRPPAPCQARLTTSRRLAGARPAPAKDKIGAEQAQSTAGHTRSGAQQSRGPPILWNLACQGYPRLPCWGWVITIEGAAGSAFKQQRGEGGQMGTGPYVRSPQ
jgi:hypothetical protein